MDYAENAIVPVVNNPNLKDELISDLTFHGINLLIEKYLSGYSESTIWHYRNDMKKFFDIIRKNIQDIDELDIIDYANALGKMGYKASSINRKIYSLSKILSICEVIGLRKGNPVRIAKENSKIIKPVKQDINIDIAKEDAIRVINSCNIRTGLIIKTLINTALRISELISVRRSDVSELNKDYLRMTVNGKGGKVRSVFITSELYQAIISTFTGTSELLFHSASGKRLSRTNLYTQIHRAFKRHIGKTVTPHTLRHFFATTKVKEGKDIKAISSYLGHSGINVTLSYYVHSKLEPEQAIII